MFDPYSRWPDFYIEERAYSQSALELLISDFQRFPDDDPTILAERFREKAVNFSEIAGSLDSRSIFEAAINVADDILLILNKEITQNEKRNNK